MIDTKEVNMDRRTLYVDVDDTLIIHDKSKFPKEQQVSVLCNGRIFIGVPHYKNILMLKKFYALGYEICVWSRTGKSWAHAVVEKFQLTEFVSYCLTKPDFYLDDKEVSFWIGPRVYREIE